MLKKLMTGLLIIGFISASLFFTSSCSRPERIDQDEAARIEAQKIEEQKRLEDQRKAEQKRLEDQRKAEQQKRLEDQRKREQKRIEDEKAAKKQALMDMENEKIYFDYDKSDLRPDAQNILTKKAEWLNNNREYSIEIQGHCDERGSTEYNLALGEKRADAAAKYMNALGVSMSRIKTISLGEEKPAVMGKNESAYEKNRRDEFILSR